MFLRLFEGWGSSYIVNHCYMPQKSRKPFLTEFQSLEPWCWLRQPFCRCIRRCRRTSLVYLVHLLSLVQAQLQNSWIPETYTNQNHVLNMIFDMFYSSVCLNVCFKSPQFEEMIVRSARALLLDSKGRNSPKLFPASVNSNLQTCLIWHPGGEKNCIPIFGEGLGKITAKNII